MFQIIYISFYAFYHFTQKCFFLYCIHIVPTQFIYIDSQNIDPNFLPFSKLFFNLKSEISEVQMPLSSPPPPFIPPPPLPFSFEFLSYFL